MAKNWTFCTFAFVFIFNPDGLSAGHSPSSSRLGHKVILVKLEILFSAGKSDFPSFKVNHETKQRFNYYVYAVWGQVRKGVCLNLIFILNVLYQLTPAMVNQGKSLNLALDETICYTSLWLLVLMG